MATIYVDQINGNDAFDGSLNRPKKTFEAAYAMIANNDTIFFKGDYKQPVKKNVSWCFIGINRAISFTIDGGSYSNLILDVPTPLGNSHAVGILGMNTSGAGATINIKNLKITYDVKNITPMGAYQSPYAPVIVNNYFDGGNTQPTKVTFSNCILHILNDVSGSKHVGLWYNQLQQGRLFMDYCLVISNASLSQSYGSSLGIAGTGTAFTKTILAALYPGTRLENATYSTSYKLLNGDNTKYGVFAGPNPWYAEAHLLESDGKYYTIDVTTGLVETTLDLFNGFLNIELVTKDIVSQLTPPVYLVHLSSNEPPYRHKDATVKWKQSYSYITANVNFESAFLTDIGNFSNDIVEQNGAYVKYFFKFDDGPWMGVEKSSTPATWVAVDPSIGASIETYGLTINDLNTMSQEIKQRFISSTYISYGIGIFTPNINSAIMYKNLMFEKSESGFYQSMIKGTDYDEYVGSNFLRFNFKQPGKYKINRII